MYGSTLLLLYTLALSITYQNLSEKLAISNLKHVHFLQYNIIIKWCDRRDDRFIHWQEECMHHTLAIECNCLWSNLLCSNNRHSPWTHPCFIWNVSQGCYCNWNV